MEKKDVKSKGSKSIDADKFEYPEDFNGLKFELIKNIKMCENITDLGTVLEEYYGEIVGRMTFGEV